MIRFLYSLLLLCVVGPALSQNYQNFQNTEYNAAILTFEGKRLKCLIENRGGPWFSDEDCMIYLYVNKKRVHYARGKQVLYKYNSLFIAKVRCDAQCENGKYKDHNIRSVEIEINKTIFIGLCCGAGAAFLLLIIAIVCGVVHCRSHYYGKLPDNQDEQMVDLEKPPVKEGKVVSTKSKGKAEKKQPRKTTDLDKELALEVRKKNKELAMMEDRKKKLSGSSESESDEDNMDGGSTNIYQYNPKYNYSEMTSEI